MTNYVQPDLNWSMSGKVLSIPYKIVDIILNNSTSATQIPMELHFPLMFSHFSPLLSTLDHPTTLPIQMSIIKKSSVCPLGMINCLHSPNGASLGWNGKTKRLLQSIKLISLPVLSPFPVTFPLNHPFHNQVQRKALRRINHRTDICLIQRNDPIPGKSSRAEGRVPLGIEANRG